MNEEVYVKICSIQLKNDSWYLCDCNDEKLPLPSKERIFSSAMKKRYLKKRKGRKDLSTVWVLVGVTNENKGICEQVGRTKDLINSLNEIRENIKDFYNSNNGKYGILKNKNYKEIVFYEVDIDKYLKDDELFIRTYGEAPRDTYLSLAYYFLRAAYVEGKIGSETSPSMYHKSSLDEYFYLHYENQKELKNKTK